MRLQVAFISIGNCDIHMWLARQNLHSLYPTDELYYCQTPARAHCCPVQYRRSIVLCKLVLALEPNSGLCHGVTQSLPALLHCGVTWLYCRYMMPLGNLVRMHATHIRLPAGCSHSVGPACAPVELADFNSCLPLPQAACGVLCVAAFAGCGPGTWRYSIGARARPGESGSSDGT